MKYAYHLQAVPEFLPCFYLAQNPGQTPPAAQRCDRGKMVKLTRQLDEEVQKRDQVSAESQQLERRLQDGRKAALTIELARRTLGRIHGISWG